MLIREWIRFIRRPEARPHAIFLSDYDMLSDMLEGREKISEELQKIIDVRTEPWGINVISVEVKDVLIPPALEDAMSMQAQAERERQARVILGDSERQVAEKFAEAAKDLYQRSYRSSFEGYEHAL